MLPLTSILKRANAPIFLPFLLVLACLISCNPSADEASYETVAKDAPSSGALASDKVVDQGVKGHQDNVNDPVIEHQVDSLEGGQDVSQSLDLNNMTVQEKKARFRALLVPPTLKVYQELLTQYHKVEGWIDEGQNIEQIKALKKAYRSETDQELLAALKPHPPSIALAQAAMESAWATSRFFVEANNVFGVWSFDEDEPRIAAGEQRGPKTIWLKKYKNIEDSVRDNYRVLARSHAFQEFRNLRLTTNDPHALVKKLDKYSEKGHEYGEELSSMIRFNQFFKYDQLEQSSIEDAL